MEEHILDLGKRQWSVSRHGLTVIGTWVRIEHRWRPCMAIIRNGMPELRPAVIPMDTAWCWSETIGDPDFRALRMLDHLGVDGSNPDNRTKLISLVNDRMQDLLSMPPRPADAEHHAEPVAAITIDNELTGKTEVEL